MPARFAFAGVFSPACAAELPSFRYRQTCRASCIAVRDARVQCEVQRRHVAACAYWRQCRGGARDVVRSPTARVLRRDPHVDYAVARDVYRRHDVDVPTPPSFARSRRCLSRRYAVVMPAGEAAACGEAASL